MTIHDEMAWTDGLAPAVTPMNVMQIILRMSDLALVISEAGVVQSVMANPSFSSRESVKDLEGAVLQDSLSYDSISKFEMRLK
jgi:hypothetical protein